MNLVTTARISATKLSWKSRSSASATHVTVFARRSNVATWSGPPVPARCVFTLPMASSWVRITACYIRNYHIIPWDEGGGGHKDPIIKGCVRKAGNLRGTSTLEPMGEGEADRKAAQEAVILAQ